MYHEIDFEVRNYTSREELRKTVVSKFLEEKPGIGRGDDAYVVLYQIMSLLNKAKRVYNF